VAPPMPRRESAGEPRRAKSWQQILIQDLWPIRNTLLICGRTFACRQAGKLIIE